MFRGKQDAGMKEKSAKARAGAIVIGSIIMAVALIAYAFSVSCSGEGNPAQEQQIEYADIADVQDFSENFYGEENWAFMSEESLTVFEETFYPWLLERGLEDGVYVYLHSEDIVCDDGIWAAYARTPIDDAYYKVTFDAATKEMTFEEVLEPDFAKRAESERTEIEGAVEHPPVSPQDSDAPTDRRDASSNIPLDDAAALSSKLPARAAESLPQIIVEYAAGKGVETSPALCSIYPASIQSTGNAVSFEMLMYDTQKMGYVISADFDEESNRFGFAMKPL
ncbi:hypothetical protein [Senegalimassilia anaerobia]|uniref:hypothetical protein n=1 Tax=Senegalimassilia anaerobia TaxID=1473216 RepID=UPI0023F2EAA9|nr:hypothetical protein [Senegalimassilia anaerobia]